MDINIRNINSSILPNHLSNKILIIKQYAFVYCLSLEEFYIENIIIYIGENVFNHWGNGEVFQNIFINVFEEESNFWNPLWNGEINSTNCDITFTGAINLQLILLCCKRCHQPFSRRVL